MYPDVVVFILQETDELKLFIEVVAFIIDIHSIVFQMDDPHLKVLGHDTDLFGVCEETVYNLVHALVRVADILVGVLG